MAEETTTDVAESSASDTIESSVTFDNLSSISIDEPIADGDETVEEPSDTPPEADEKVAPEKDEEGDKEVDGEKVDEPADDTPTPEAESEEDTPDEDVEISESDEKPKGTPKFVWDQFRSLKALDKNVLLPLRDPTATPIEKFNAVLEYTPDGAKALAEEAAKHSVEQYPDAWLAHILQKEGATVESVKAALSGTATPAKEQAAPITTSEYESFADNPDALAYAEYLSDIYGEDWRDPANDADLADDDAPGVRVFRANLALEDKRKAEFDRMQGKINELEPTVQSIAETQATQEEQQIDRDYQTARGAYEERVTAKGIQSALKAENLLPSDKDDEITAEIKSQIGSSFQPYAEEANSDFDRYVMHKFSDREKLGTIIQRVDGNIRKAEKSRYLASKETDPAKAKELLKQAEALTGHANEEEAVLTVLAKKAAKEFMSKEHGPLKKALTELSRLRAQLKGNVREEVTNGTGATGSKEDAVNWENVGKISIV